MRGALSFSTPGEVIKYIDDNTVRIVNLCHVPEDGKLKTLSFSTSDQIKVGEILELGERVDGSSLFSFIEPGRSDLYIRPKLDHAFVHPFASLTTLNIMCSYLDGNGNPLNIAPETVLRNAEDKLKRLTGVSVRALAEVEFYIIASPQMSPVYLGQPDRNYHDSAPFARFENLRNEILASLSLAGIVTKYGHCEVGRVIRRDGTYMEQHEIELEAEPLADAAETVAIVKWTIRNVAALHGTVATFLPKVDLDHAGNGMHVHLCAMKNNRNIIANTKGDLSKEAKAMIGGILKHAKGLSAFANTTPASYLRLIARKETPLQVCWSSHNRLALIRVPLWGINKVRNKTQSARETFEYRAADAFANTHLLLAALTLSTAEGLTNETEMSRLAEESYVEPDRKPPRDLISLPLSCSEAAENLRIDREFYEKDDVFPSNLIAGTIERLKNFEDISLGSSAKRRREIENLITKYLHYG